MSNNPYKTTEVDLGSQTRQAESRPVLLLLTTLILVALAFFCFYSVYLITDRSANYLEHIEQLEELSNRIETRELTLKRESLLKYFDASREAAEEELEIQNEAFLGFLSIGLVLFIIAVLQLVAFRKLRKWG